LNIEELREYCISKPYTTEGLPFDDVSLVFKVKGKIFAILSLDGPPRINLKCDPEKAIELREEYSCVIPGYHMNKKLWNTVYIDGSVQAGIIKEWIDHSYELILASLPKSKR